MNRINKVASEVKSRQDFAAFLRILVEDLEANKANWENDILETYLEAFSGWVDDMEGVFLNSGEPMPKDFDWKLLARMFLAARNYE